MALKIACLHTAESNASVLDQALDTLGPGNDGTDVVALVHHVYPQLLDEALKAGGLTPEIAAKAQLALNRAADGVDGLLLTCSTLGPALDQMLQLSTPHLRVDRALARACNSRHGPFIVLATIETTLDPTRRLFGPSAEVALVPDAWPFFETGDQLSYLKAIAETADQKIAQGYEFVALAQVSMAPACNYSRHPTQILNSPGVGLRQIISMAQAVENIGL